MKKIASNKIAIRLASDGGGGPAVGRSISETATFRRWVRCIIARSSLSRIGRSLVQSDIVNARGIENTEDVVGGSESSVYYIALALYTLSVWLLRQI